jgi:hypothetical protein
VIGYPAKNISQPNLRVDAIELGRFDQRVCNRRRLSSTLRPSKKPIFPPESYASHAAFSGIVVDAQTSIVEIGPQSFKLRQAIADRASQGRLARDLCELQMEPSFKIIDEWCCIFLPDRSAPVRWIATNGSISDVRLPLSGLRLSRTHPPIKSCKARQRTHSAQELAA